MKTSQLINKLIEINKTVPFDADIVTGDDWLFQPVSKVYHNPPHTYIEFESFEEDEWSEDLAEENRKATIKELATRAHMLQQVIEMIEKSPQHSREDIIQELGKLSEQMHSMVTALQNQ
jgi:hypothetical protein